MRVLITLQPGSGHFNPLAPIGQALQAEGHEVLVACSQSFIPRVERENLPVVAAGVDWLENEPELAFPEVEDMTTIEKELFLVEIFTDITANHMAHDLMTIAKDWQPDIIVRDNFEYGACIVGEVLDIPHIPVDMELFIPHYVTKKGMESQLAYLRSAYNLPPYPAMEMLTRYGYISYIPPSYQIPEYAFPDNTINLRPDFLQAYGNDPLPSWFHQLPDQPNIYASMGTTFNRVPSIFKTIIDGLADLPLNLIITVGPNQDPQQFAPFPRNVHIERFIPQTALMPHTAGIICNGGVGTIMIALTAGIPIIVVPLSGHLRLHSQRCNQLNVGQSLKLPLSWYNIDSSDIDEEEHFAVQQAKSLAYDQSPLLTPENIRDAVTGLIDKPQYRQVAQTLQAEIESLPSANSIIPFLEQLATQKGG